MQPQLDVSVYRGGSGLLQTDNNFNVNGNLSVFRNVLLGVSHFSTFCFARFLCVFVSFVVVAQTAKDTNIYRAAAGQLQTDSSFAVKGTFNPQATIVFGPQKDVNLYRLGVGQLTTDNGLTVKGNITANSALTVKGIVNAQSGMVVQTNLNVKGTFCISERSRMSLCGQGQPRHRQSAPPPQPRAPFLASLLQTVRFSFAFACSIHTEYVGAVTGVSTISTASSVAASTISGAVFTNGSGSHFNIYFFSCLFNFSFVCFDPGVQVP